MRPQYFCFHLFSPSKSEMIERSVRRSVASVRRYAAGMAFALAVLSVSLSAGAMAESYACACPQPCRPQAAAGSEVFVRFVDAPSESALNELRSLGSDLKRLAAEVHGWRYALHLVDPLEVESLRTIAGVVAVEPACSYRPQQVPTAPTTTSWNLQAIGAQEAWAALGGPAVSAGLRPVLVGVVDTGVATDHPDLVGQISSHRFDPSGAGDLAAGSAHGTAVSSIVAALVGNDDSVPQGIDGVMPGASIVPCKIGSAAFGSEGAVLTCLAWIADLADQGVPVLAVNLSFASPCCSCEMDYEIRRLRARGILLVAVAGNDAGDNDDPTACPVYPGALPVSNIIAVTGVDRFGNLSGRRGRRTVHVAAPAQSIPVLSPDGGKTIMPGGTSFAAPHVTAVLALLKAQDSSRSWSTLRNLVLTGGRPNPRLAGMTISERSLLAYARNGLGEMSCSGQRLQRRTAPVASDVELPAGGTLSLRALSLLCGAGVGPVRVSVKRLFPSSAALAPFFLTDSGTGTDEVAGDGEFTGTWTAPLVAPAKYRLSPWSAAGEAVTVSVH